MSKTEEVLRNQLDEIHPPEGMSGGHDGKKVCVIGLDGMTWTLLRPWIDAGELPNFERLTRQGTYGKLKSVIRPGSPQAWSSFITGKNPGKHGIFYFIERKPNSYDIQFVNARARRGESLWGIMSKAGKRTTVLNVPITFPPEPVNGYFVSGMDTPGTECEFTWPPELKDEMRSEVGEYIIEAGVWGHITGGHFDRAIARLHETIESHYNHARYLMRKSAWDFFMVVFTAPDRVEHNFWKYYDPESPLYSEEGNKLYGNAMLDVYKHLDKIVGEMELSLPDDCVLMLMSDHGMGAITDKTIYLNKWLAQEGFLTFKDEKDGKPRGPVGKLKSLIFVDGLKFVRRQLWKRLHRRTKEKLVRIFPWARDKMSSVFYFSRIDMGRTQAFAEENRSIIWLNVEGRDPKGVVKPGEEYERVRDEIIKRLEDLVDPWSGEKVIDKAYRREEIYHGPCVERSPDIIIMWNRDQWTSRPSYQSKRPEPLRKLPREEMEHLEYNLQANAEHRIDGIFFCKGEGIKQNYEIPDAEIQDLAPTILHIAGLEVPSDMDGKVLESCFEEKLLSRSVKKKMVEESLEDETTDTGYSDDESKLIHDRLESLGYLG